MFLQTSNLVATVNSDLELGGVVACMSHVVLLGTDSILYIIIIVFTYLRPSPIDARVVFFRGALKRDYYKGMNFHFWFILWI